MRGLSLCLTVFLLLAVGVLGTAGAQDGWDRGENRIGNSGFENDEVGGLPDEWSLKKEG